MILFIYHIMYLKNIHQCQYMLVQLNLHHLARETSEKIEIDDEVKKILDGKIQMLVEKLKTKPEISITYFVSDLKKDGGAYITVDGIIKKIDMYEQCIFLADNTEIPMNDIIDISGEIFENF